MTKKSSTILSHTGLVSSLPDYTGHQEKNENLKQPTTSRIEETPSWSIMVTTWRRRKGLQWELVYCSDSSTELPSKARLVRNGGPLLYLAFGRSRQEGQAGVHRALPLHLNPQKKGSGARQCTPVIPSPRKQEGWQAAGQPGIYRDIRPHKQGNKADRTWKRQMNNKVTRRLAERVRMRKRTLGTNPKSASVMLLCRVIHLLMPCTYFLPNFL